MQSLSIPTPRPARRRIQSVIRIATLILAASFCPLLIAQTPPNPAGNPARSERRQRRNFDPSAMRNRMMDAVRKAFGVTNDDEWSLIEKRLRKVMRLERRSGANAFQVFRTLGGDEEAGNRRRFFRGAMSSETTALLDALRNQAPEAEIKTLLETLRASRKKDAAELTKAQEDLRAVLSVRQEAVAVAAGLLP